MYLLVFAMLCWGLYSCSTDVVKDEISPILSPPSPISGYITIGRGGAPVSGSTVVLKKSNEDTTLATTTSNTEGYFSFENYETIDGDFVVEASNATRASSRAEFTVINNTIPILSLQQFSVAQLELSTVSPRITLSGITSNQNITTTDILTIMLTASTTNSFVPSNSRHTLAVSIGNIGTSNYSATSVNDTLTFQLDPTKLPAGNNFIEFISYDNNNNQAILIIPISISLPTNSSDLNAPGTSTATDIIITAESYGEHTNLYAVSEDTRIQVEILIDIGDGQQTASEGLDGIVAYRKKHGESMYQWIGSTNQIIQYNNNADNLYFRFWDRLPTTSDGTIYIYKFKYYYFNEAQQNIQTTGTSPEILVPILPRYDFTLDSPTNNIVYETMPSSIVFKWEASYDPSIFTTLNSYFSNSASLFSRTDFLYLIELGTTTTLYNNSISISNFNTIGLQTTTLDTSTFTIPPSGKHMYWTVTSKINYSYAGDSSNKLYYVVYTTSYPTLKSGFLPGNAQNGVYYITIK